MFVARVIVLLNITYFRFAHDLGRFTYITPTSYLTLISSFKELLSQKQEEIHSAIERYERGLNQLEYFSKTITGMQKDIEELQPQLVVAQKEAEEFIEVRNLNFIISLLMNLSLDVPNNN